MSTANAKNGSAIEPRAAQETTSQVPAHRPTPGLHQDQGLLLAQIPDLDPKATPEVPEKRLDGRIISQALSIKLVFGVGIGLVIGAILPFVFGKASRPESRVKELPAWASMAVLRGIPRRPRRRHGRLRRTRRRYGSAADTARSWRRRSSRPSAAGWRHSADRPDRTGLAAAAIGRRSGACRHAFAGANNYINPPVANTNPPDNRGDNRGFDRVPADSRNSQADNRNDPAALYRNNDARYDYRGNAMETAPARRDVSANGISRATPATTTSAMPTRRLRVQAAR